MSERNESQRKRFSPARVAAGLAFVTAGATVIFRPDVYTYLFNQADNALHPEPTLAAVSPSVLRTPAVSATPAQLGEGRGKPPVSFSWKTSNFDLYGTEIQSKESITDEPNGPRAIAWTEKLMGACAAKGNVFIGAHSDPDAERDAGLVPQDFMRRLGETGVGSVVELKTADGTRCRYVMEWFKSVEKFGDGAGTFMDLVKNNPTGRDLRDPNVEPGIVFVSCDELEGWNFEEGTSNNNLVGYGELAQVIPPKEK